MKFLKSAWANITWILGALVGLLIYWITLKNKKLNALSAKIELVKTEKEADILETEIKKDMVERKMIKKELDDLEKSLVLLDQRREDIKKSQGNKSAKEIEDYWNNDNGRDG